MTSRQLGGLRSGLALDAGHTNVHDHGDHRLLVTPECPDYWEGNCLLLDEPPATPDDRPAVWANALARWRYALASTSLAATRHPMVRWESTDARPIAPALLPRGAAHAQDTVHVLNGWRKPTRPVPAVACRPASSDDDWQAIVEMVRGAAHEERYVEYVRWSYAKARKAFARAASTWWMAEYRGEVVGSLGLFRGDGIARFQELETRETHRGRGIASLLIGRALAERPAADATPVYIVAETGAAPERLYRSLGFAPVSWVHSISWDSAEA